MKLHLSRPASINLFTGYGPGFVLVNGERIARSVIVMPDQLIDDWSATTFDALQPGQMVRLAELAPEIVLLGTGDRIRFPRPDIMRPLIDAGFGFEVMDAQAACRTYNILVSEDRKVAAALLLGTR